MDEILTGGSRTDTTHLDRHLCTRRGVIAGATVTGTIVPLMPLAAGVPKPIDDQPERRQLHDAPRGAFGNDRREHA